MRDVVDPETGHQRGRSWGSSYGLTHRRRATKARVALLDMTLDLGGLPVDRRPSEGPVAQRR